MNLYTSYFRVSDPKRQAEIDLCLKKNVNNPLIKKIYCLIEEPLEIISDKVETITIKGRPTYNVFFSLINEKSNEEDWNIISNSDIYFDNTLNYLHKYSKAFCIALTRYEVKSGVVKFLGLRDSQDCWMFKGKVRNIAGDFMMGKAGCDNAIANRISRAGYSVINPSKSIKSYHLHESPNRGYDPNDKVPQPYMFLNPVI